MWMWVWGHGCGCISAWRGRGIACRILFSLKASETTTRISVGVAHRHPGADRRGSWPPTPRSCRKRSKPESLRPGQSPIDITIPCQSRCNIWRVQTNKLTLSMASRSSSVTLIAWAPGGSGASSSPSSPSRFKNCSGFCAINCASWGFPAPSCCRMGSSICGCCWTTCRSCWNWALFLRKSRFPRSRPPAPAPAAATAAAAAAPLVLPAPPPPRPP